MPLNKKPNPNQLLTYNGISGNTQWEFIPHLIDNHK